MCEWRPPSALLRAGAMTRANRIGVIIGTAIWRGLCAVSAARRDASVRRARPRRGGRRAGARGVRLVDSAMLAAIVLAPFRAVSGGEGEVVARQPQVDVVERGFPGADRTGAQPCVVDCGDRVAGGRPV